MISIIGIFLVYWSCWPYDHILHDHLEMIRQHKKGRLTHYLSPQAQNELINLCGEQVRNTFLAEREAAIYYSIICESTLDVSDTEQNVLLLRCTYQYGHVWKITERFCQFKDMQ